MLFYNGTLANNFISLLGFHSLRDDLLGLFSLPHSIWKCLSFKTPFGQLKTSTSLHEVS